MKATKTRLVLSLTAVAAISVTPAAAATGDEAVVPPSNSAATQYTETFPTTGGDKKTDQKPKHRSPTKVLGSHNTKKLEEQGPEGKAAAEAAAATAPTSIATPPPAQTSPAHGADDGGQGAAGGRGGSGKGNGGADTPLTEDHAASGSGTAHRPTAPEPTGSSGVGSAIGQATGLSTAGQSGMLLPLVILATILWSLIYFWRQRRQVG